MKRYIYQEVSICKGTPIMQAKTFLDECVAMKAVFDRVKELKNEGYSVERQIYSVEQCTNKEKDTVVYITLTPEEIEDTIYTINEAYKDVLGNLRFRNRPFENKELADAEFAELCRGMDLNGYVKTENDFYTQEKDDPKVYYTHKDGDSSMVFLEKRIMNKID